MWIFPNLPKNIDKFPIPRATGPVPKIAVTALHSVSYMNIYSDDSFIWTRLFPVDISGLMSFLNY